MIASKEIQLEEAKGRGLACKKECFVAFFNSLKTVQGRVSNLYLMRDIFFLFSMNCVKE